MKIVQLTQKGIGHDPAAFPVTDWQSFCNSSGIVMGELPYILIADDDPDDLQIFEEAFNLAYSHIRVVSVHDGDDVLTYLGAHEDALPELIILDYNMPRVSGAECLWKLAATPRYGSIPKVVWTTSHRELEIGKCIALGATRVFLKPMDDKELLRIVVQLADFLVAGDYFPAGR